MSTIPVEVKKWLDRPMSVTVDVVAAVAIGAAAFFLIGIIKGLLPFGDAVQASGAGVVGALFYMRARSNHPLNFKAS